MPLTFSNTTYRTIDCKKTRSSGQNAFSLIKFENL